VAVDPADGDAKALALPIGCGDTPFCLISAGEKLVISSVGDTQVFDPARLERPRSRHLGRGWITVPSQRPGRVWLGILANGKLGGPHTRGLQAVREVDLRGRVVRSMRPPGGKWPVQAVRGGLLFQGDERLRFWSFAERRFTMNIVGPFPAAAHGNVVASCGEPCQELVITDVRSEEVARIPPPTGYAFIATYEGAFSPDGSMLAVPAVRRVAGNGPANTRGREALAVIDVAGESARIVAGRERDDVYAAMTWSSASDELFFAGDGGWILSHEVESEAVSRLVKLPLRAGGLILEIAVVPSSRDLR
jgi:hypothetical protein